MAWSGALALSACGDDSGASDDGDTEATGTSGGDADNDDGASDPDASVSAEDGTNDTNEACGNGTKDVGEDCDGSDVGLADCVSEGFDEGTLGCNADCTFDTSACIQVDPVCGDNVIDRGEECDSRNHGGQSCESLRFDSGELACARDCTFDTSGCVSNVPVCGDGVAELLEECDGEDLDGTNCGNLGFAGGNLACADDCTFDTSGCADGGSCTGLCGDPYDPNLMCQCDAECMNFNDCCEDVCPQCDGIGGVSCDGGTDGGSEGGTGGGGSDSCTDNCGVYDPEALCQCDSKCTGFGDCCDDICPQCGGVNGVVCEVGSCTDNCGAPYDRTAPCQCDSGCAGFGDCCEDICPQCEGIEGITCEAGSCTDNCGAPYDRTAPCQCDSGCAEFGDCCADICPQCDGMGGVTCDGGGTDSCTGLCGAPVDPNASCQCDPDCAANGNCCADICPQCDGMNGVTCDGGAMDSCTGLCGAPVDPNAPCQCDPACAANGNCCADICPQCDGMNGVTC